METIKIVKLSIFTKSPDGKEYITKFNKPYSVVKIEDETGRQITVKDWNGISKDWSVGMELAIDIREKEFQGRKYYEGSLPSGTGGVMAKLNKIEGIVVAIFDKVNKTPVKDLVKEDDDLPF